MEWLIEIIVGVLLAATCVYCYLLSRKLQSLREGQTELLTVIAKFDDASQRAELNLAAMKTNSVTMSRDLGDVTKRAHALIDELSVMVHAGDHVAGRIEGAVQEFRTIRSIGDVRKAS